MHIKKTKNYIWSVLEYMWFPIMAIGTTPIFLNMLGAEKYGNWMFLLAIISFSAMLSGGTGAAVIKDVSACNGLNKCHEIQNVVSSALAMSIIGGGIIAISLFVFFWYAGDSILNKMGGVTTIRITGGFSAFLLWIDQVDNVFTSTLKGAERFGLTAKIEIISRTAQIVVSLIVVFYSSELFSLYCTITFFTCLKLIIKIIFTCQITKSTEFRPTFTRIKTILHFAKWGWIKGISGLLFTTADRIIIGSLLGASTLAHYTIASQLSQQIHAVTAAGFSVIFPMLSRMTTQNINNKSIWDFSKKAIIFNLLICSALAIILLMFGRQLLTMWLGLSNAEDCYQILQYLTIAYWVLSLSIAPHFLLLGAGEIRFIAISGLGGALAFLLIVYFSYPIQSMNEIAFARICYGLVNLSLFVPVAKIFKR